MLSLLILMVMVMPVMAQPKKEETPKKEEDAPSVKKDDEIPRLDASMSAFVIVCDSQPSKMLVLDSTGKWMSTVKSVDVKVEIGQPATITCTLYEGYLKPTKPQVRTWQLAQMKTVTATEFQQMVDAIQSNPDAIKDMLKK